MIAVLTDIIQSTTILIGAVIMFFLIRRVNRHETRRETRVIHQDPGQNVFQIQDPQPVCGCGHHQCFHDENGCGKPVTYSRYNETEALTCGCKRYTGPEPLPTVIP